MSSRFKKKLSSKLFFISLTVVFLLLCFLRLQAIFVTDYLLTADEVIADDESWSYKKDAGGLSQDRLLFFSTKRLASLETSFYTKKNTYSVWLRFRAGPDMDKVVITIADKEFEINQKDLAKLKWVKIANINLTGGQHLFYLRKLSDKGKVSFDSLYLTNNLAFKPSSKAASNVIAINKTFRFMFNLLLVAVYFSFYLLIIVIFGNTKKIFNFKLKSYVRKNPSKLFLLGFLILFSLSCILEALSQLVLASWPGLLAYICLVIAIFITFGDFCQRRSIHIASLAKKKQSEGQFLKISKKITQNRLTQILLIILVFLILAIIFTWPAVVSPKTHAYGPIFGTDVRGTLWRFWWSDYAAKNNIGDVNFIPIIAHPFGKTQSINNNYLWFLESRFLTSLGGEVFALNFIIVKSFILSGLFMYLLAFYLSRSHLAALVAGIIYSFCPYHFNKAWEHISLSIIEWLPLYVLLLLKLKNSRSLKNLIFCAIGFSAVLYFNYYYAYFMIIFTHTLIPIYFL